MQNYKDLGAVYRTYHVWEPCFTQEILFHISLLLGTALKSNKLRT